jgi:ferredoxin
MGPAQIAGIAAATPLMRGQPNAAANGVLLTALSKRLLQQNSFKRMTRVPAFQQLAREGRGTDLIVRMGEARQEESDSLTRYRRGPETPAPDAEFLTRAMRAMRESGRGWTPAEWGLRWLYNQPEVTVVLSGMNSVEMVEANCRTAGEAAAGSLTEADFETLEKVKRAIREKEKVGCTGCRYCMPCPKGVDIPGIFRSYNTMFSESKSAGRSQFIQTVALTKEPSFASQCVRCGKCEQHCPQSIPIREKLREADAALRPLPYKIAIQAARAFMFRKAK